MLRTVTTAPPSRELVEAPEETLAFTVPRFDPVGLAYDAVSRRFIVGDHTANRLLVIDELSHHVTPLVSAASAGFYEAITAFEIDARRGDLWVASVNSAGPDSVVHKLQLVSGRVLEEVRVGSDDKCRIGDLAVLADGTILALDSQAGRIFRLQPGSRRMDVMGKSVVPAGARSFTLANDRLIYVASDEGITRVDLQTKEVAAVRLPKGTDLGRIEKIRWHDGGLVIVTRTVGGESQIQRARMDSGGQAIARLQVLTAARDADPRTVTLSGPLFYTWSEARTNQRFAALACDDYPFVHPGFLEVVIGHQRRTLERLVERQPVGQIAQEVVHGGGSALIENPLQRRSRSPHTRALLAVPRARRTTVWSSARGMRASRATSRRSRDRSSFSNSTASPSFSHCGTPRGARL